MAKTKKEWPLWTLLPAYVAGAWVGLRGRRLVDEKVVSYRLQRLVRDCSLIGG